MTCCGKELCVVIGSRGVRVFRGLAHVCGAIFVQLLIAQAKTRVFGMILGCSQLAMELVGANIGRVLISGAVCFEGFVGDGYRVFARFRFALPHRESVIACARPGLEPDELDDDFSAQSVPGTAFLPAVMPCISQMAPETKRRRTGKGRPALVD